MIVPTHCPKCGDALVTDYYNYKDGNYFVKRCKKRPDHQFQCSFEESKNELRSVTISISMNPLTRVAWDFQHKTCSLNVGTLEEIIKNNTDEGYPLPFWNPDFSNWGELVQKIKTYLIFS